MADYFITVRNVRRGNFGAEPGPTRFLQVPGNRKPKPDHKINRGAWVDAVLAAGHTGQDPHSGEDCGDIVVFVHGYNTSPGKAVNVNCGTYFDKRYGDGGDNGHSWYFRDSAFLADLAATLSGDSDRQVIGARRLDARGRLHLT